MGAVDGCRVVSAWADDGADEAAAHGDRQQQDGEALLAPAVTRAMIEEFARRSPIPPPTLPPALGRLTPRGHDIFDLLARGLSKPRAL